MFSSFTLNGKSSSLELLPLPSLKSASGSSLPFSPDIKEIILLAANFWVSILVLAEHSSKRWKMSLRFSWRLVAFLSDKLRSPEFRPFWKWHLTFQDIRMSTLVLFRTPNVRSKYHWFASKAKHMTCHSTQHSTIGIHTTEIWIPLLCDIWILFQQTIFFVVKGKKVDCFDAYLFSACYFFVKLHETVFVTGIHVLVGDFVRVQVLKKVSV